MIHIINELNKLKDTNILFYLESKECLKELKLFDLDKAILDSILFTIDKKENTMKEYFYWKKGVNSIFVISHLDKNKRNLYELLWEFITKLPKNITVLSNTKANLLTIVDSCLLSRYKFQKYLSEKKEDDINIFCDKVFSKKVQDRIETLENVLVARDLWETPTSDLYPEKFANLIKKTKWKNTKIKVLWSKELQKQWLGLLWAVWKWSHYKPCMVIIEKIIDKKLPTIWIVWKGIVFDSGWLNLKPEEWLYAMKDDMCWAANVYAIMKEIDKKELNINVVACIPLAENAVSWEAYRPSDIIKSYSGKTVNITNTDAEWRLILADSISYISKNYKLDRIISVATLTGACLYTLGYRYAWIMWDDKDMINKFLDYSKDNFEKYIELPFDKYYIEKTKSTIADFDNWTAWIYSGPSMWAAFMHNFILNNEKYTHIDIAWVANNRFEAYGLFPKSTTGFWVLSISEILLNLK